MPLHLQAAEALGWLHAEMPNGLWPDEWIGYHPIHAPLIGEKAPIPRYDTDWAATGPLIERYRFKLEPGYLGWSVFAYSPNHHGEDAWGTTPLIAACNLLIHFGFAKLRKEGP